MATKLVYYSQEDPRWRNLLYSNRRDLKQTIATSGCGPTCFAMVVSSFTGRAVLPPETAKFATDKGFRTDNNGTAWGYFADAAQQYGLTCRQTGKFDEAKLALTSGALVIASMRSGHFTGGGHYVLLVDNNGEWVEVFDPNHDNKKYGADGLVKQGIKDDGKVLAAESLIRREAGQYWIFTYKPPKSSVKETSPSKTDPTVRIIANGKDITGGELRNGRVWGPLRAVAEALGAVVHATAGSIYLDGKPYTETNNEVVAGKTIVPLSSLANAISAQLTWDNDNKTATLTK